MSIFHNNISKITPSDSEEKQIQNEQIQRQTKMVFNVLKNSLKDFRSENLVPNTWLDL